MALPGPPPKDPDKRARRNKPAEFVELPASGPDEPRKLPNRGDYLVRTRQWWDAWATSPQATQFTETAWQRLRMVAVLVDEFYRTGSKDLLAEIRLQESKLGATPEDMQKLRWRVAGDDEDQGQARRPTARRSDDPRRHLRAVE